MCGASFHFESVIEVDEIGDNITDHPHVYVAVYNGIARPFAGEYPHLARADHWAGDSSVEPNPKMRMERFHAKFRKPLPKHVLAAAEDDDPN